MVVPGSKQARAGHKTQGYNGLIIGHRFDNRIIASDEVILFKRSYCHIVKYKTAFLSLKSGIEDL